MAIITNKCQDLEKSSEEHRVLGTIYIQMNLPLAVSSLEVPTAVGNHSLEVDIVLDGQSVITGGSYCSGESFILQWKSFTVP